MFFPIITVIFLVALIIWPPHEAAKRTFGHRSTYWHSCLCFLAYPLLTPLVILGSIRAGIRWICTDYCRNYERYAPDFRFWFIVCSPILFPYFLISLLCKPPTYMTKKVICRGSGSIDRCCCILIWFFLYPVIILYFICLAIYRGYQKCIRKRDDRYLHENEPLIENEMV